jgi:hypothetical protein
MEVELTLDAHYDLDFQQLVEVGAMQPAFSLNQ